MRRLVIDTNIYIDWFNAGLHEDILTLTFRGMQTTHIVNGSTARETFTCGSTRSE